jgi:REP element-mobilizing transposase RayT
MFAPEEIYFVSIRCSQSRRLLRPSDETNAVLGGVLARAVRKHDIELFAYTVMSTHLHLVLRAPRGNLPRFMQYLLANVSKKVGALIGWRGSFWQSRYSVQPILDDAALLDRIRYVLAHGVKEGLVRSCDDWPGLSSLAQMRDGKPRRFRWFNWTRRSSGNALRQPRPRFDPRWAEAEELTLAELPVAGLDTREKVKRFLEETIRAIEEQAAKTFRTVSGRRAVLAEHPHRRARRPKRQPRPWCHTTVAELRRQFLNRFRAFADAFHRASSRWRVGDFRSVFPEHAVRPFYWPGAVAGQITA